MLRREQPEAAIIKAQQPEELRRVAALKCRTRRRGPRYGKTPQDKGGILDLLFLRMCFSSLQLRLDAKARLENVVAGLYLFFTALACNTDA